MRTTSVQTGPYLEGSGEGEVPPLISLATLPKLILSIQQNINFSCGFKCV